MSFLYVDFTPIYETLINFMVGVKDMMSSFTFTFFGINFDMWHWFYALAFIIFLGKIIHSAFNFMQDLDSVNKGAPYIKDYYKQQGSRNSLPNLSHEDVTKLRAKSK